MSIDTTEREHQRLLEVAREYKQRGYEVIIQPATNQLPDFLTPYQVDLVASNADEHVVVEIRSQDSMMSAPELDAVARAVFDKPAWRFELVVTNPKDRSALQFKHASPLDYQDIAYRLHEARQLANQEYGEGAFLLAWSSTEALLRMLAHEEDVAMPQNLPGQLVKSLYISGALDESQYRALQRIVHMRDLLVHGYKTDQSLADALDELFGIADQLLQQQSTT